MFNLKWNYKGQEYFVVIEDYDMYNELLIGLTKLGYVQPFLCECELSKNSNHLYTYVALGIEVKEGDNVIVPVTNSFGEDSEIPAVIRKFKPVTLDDIRAAAAAINRKKLKRIRAIV